MSILVDHHTRVKCRIAFGGRRVPNTKSHLTQLTVRKSDKSSAILCEPILTIEPGSVATSSTATEIVLLKVSCLFVES